MQRDEMIEVADMLSGAYRFLDFSNESTFETWYEILKGYEVGEVRQACRNWIAWSRNEPTPADILDATKNVRIAQRRVQQESMDYQALHTVRCPKCNDRGYVLVRYPGGYEELRACDCLIAHDRFAYLFTEEFAAKADRITAAERPYGDGWWKAMRYKFDIQADAAQEDAVREIWRRKKIREIKSVEASGQVIMNVEVAG